MPVVQRGGEVVEQGPPTVLAHAERPGDRRHDQRRVIHRRQVDEADAAGVVAPPVGGHLQGQAGLAHARRADDRHQAHVRPREQAGERGQLRGAAEQRRRRHRHGRPVGGRRRARPLDRAGAEARGERGRLGVGLGAELLGQHAAAALVLRQRRLALAAGGEEQHELPVGVLAPGVERQQPGGVVDPGGVVAPLGGVDGQLVEGVQRELAQALALGGEPLVEGGGAVDGEARQQLTAVELRRGAEPLQRRRRAGRRPGVRPAQRGLERLDVEPAGGGAVEGDRLAGDQQVAAGGAAQVGQDGAQVLAGGGVGQVAPQQRRERLAGVRPAGEGEVGEQRPALGVGEAGQQRAAAAQAQPAQQLQA